MAKFKVTFITEGEGLTEKDLQDDILFHSLDAIHNVSNLKIVELPRKEKGWGVDIVGEWDSMYRALGNSTINEALNKGWVPPDINQVISLWRKELVELAKSDPLCIVEMYIETTLTAYTTVNVLIGALESYYKRLAREFLGGEE